jgi:hypothetical protein
VNICLKAKAALIGEPYAALKRRSSTLLRAVVIQITVGLADQRSYPDEGKPRI